jgi:hypothetical protein
MQFEAHRCDDAEVAAAAQCPEQLRFVLVVGDEDASVREDDLCGLEIVEREPEPADQGAVAAAKRESGHSDGCDGACHRGEAERIRRADNVRGVGPSRNCRRLVGRDRHISHSAQIDGEAVAQGPTGPIVASAAHRERKIAVARGANGRQHVVDRPAVGDRARQAPDRF